jgi:phenylpyruvate tautomerase PptA (4-oxalocrotonate tautomerase family)
MPLVRIDVVEGRRTPAELRLLADTVQEVALDACAAPPGDRYQVVTEHRPGQLICEDTGLGMERADDLVVLQVFQQGRSEERGTRDGAARPPSRSSTSQERARVRTGTVGRAGVRRPPRGASRCRVRPVTGGRCAAAGPR